MRTVNHLFREDEIVAKPCPSEEHLVATANRIWLESNGEYGVAPGEVLPPCPGRIVRTKTLTLTSEYIGVTGIQRVSGQRIWQARCVLRGKAHWLGDFDNEVDAARARDAFVRSHATRFGKVMRLNFGEAA